MRSRKILVSLLVFPVLLLATVAMAQPALGGTADNIVDGLDVSSEQHSTRIVLKGQKTPTFTVFKLKNPDRLVVDLIHTDLQGLETPAEINDQRISRIATTQFKQAGSVVSRFIIGLEPGVKFQARAEGNSVLVTVTGKDAPEVARVTEESPKNPAAQAVAGLTEDEVEQETEPEPSVEKQVAADQEPQKDFRVVQAVGDKHKAGKIKIRKVDVDGKGKITVRTSSAPGAYQVLEVFSPFRVVLDVWGASMRKKKFEKAVAASQVSRVRVARHPDKVRVVIDCSKGERKPYRIEKLARGIRFVFLDRQNEVALALPKARPEKTRNTGKAKQGTRVERDIAPQKAEITQIEQAPPKPAKPARLKDIDFRQEPDLARVVIDLEGEASPAVTHTDSRSAVLEIDKCKIPMILERTLDTSEFGSAIRSLSAYRVRGKKKVKLVAVTSERVANRIERRAGRLHWVFEAARKNDKAQTALSTKKPGQEESKSYSYEPDQVAGYSVRRPDLAAGSGSGKKRRRRYRGRRISLDFKDADIHNILRLISEVAKLNIITSDEVKGTITITMRNVPWDQALDIILKTKKLGKVRHGNIIRVAPMAQLAQEQEMAAKAAEARKTLEPLRVRLIPVNYAVAKNIEKQVKDILSDRGTINVDERTNVLIVKDILENLVKAEGLVRSLDTETPQVLIEARVVEANTQFVREVGIQWGGDMSFTEQNGNPTGLPFPSSIKIQGGADDQKSQNPLAGTAVPGKFAINMPAAVGAGSGGALGFIFGSAGGHANLNLRLSALENTGAVKIVSAPKIATLDNQKAKISQGVSVPISVVSAAGVNTQFVEAKLELEVSPHITQQGSILLDIRVKKNEPDFSRTGARGDPTILKKEAETQVLVRDGDTTVIGGIYTRKTSETISGVPILSQIPVLGWFFRNTKKNDDRTELLIFITPRIVNRLQATVSQR